MKKSISKAKAKLQLSAKLMDVAYQPESAIFVERDNDFYYRGSEQSIIRMSIDKKGQSLKVISQIPDSEQHHSIQREYYQERLINQKLPKKVNVCKIGLMTPVEYGMLESILYKNQKSPSCKVTEYKEKHPKVNYN